MLFAHKSYLVKLLFSSGTPSLGDEWELACGCGRLSGFVPLREATSEGRFVAASA